MAAARPAGVQLLLFLGSLVAASGEPITGSPFTDYLGPFIPFGFYQYTVTEPRDVSLPAEESLYGMTLTSPYASTAAPTEEWFTSMTSFLDGAHAAGMSVNFQLIAFEALGNDEATLANLTAQIERFKDHPAIMAWYLADEPGGSGIPNATLQPKYDAVKKADPSGRPVTMVFCTTQAADYLDALDVIMVDPYPIPGAPAGTVQSALANVAALGKPVMMVPQAFGGGENWARTPSAAEERIMTYIGLFSGAKAMQYFVRSPEGSFPYSPRAWSEIRSMANEVRELTPALLGERTVVNLTAAVTHSDGADDDACSVQAQGWVDRDGSLVVVAINTLNGDGPPCAFTLTTGLPSSDGGALDCVSLFENRKMTATVSADGFTVSFADALRGFGTAAYRIRATTTTAAAAAAAAANLVYNGDYEESVNPATPDGHYVTQLLGGGFFFGEYRDSVSGLASMRLHSPANATGAKLSPYTVPAPATGGGNYSFSVWVKGAVGGETVVFDFAPHIFSSAGLVGGALAVTATTAWQQTTVQLTMTDDPKTACPYGCRGWMSYAMTTAGDVLLDDLTLVVDSSSI